MPWIEGLSVESEVHEAIDELAALTAAKEVQAQVVTEGGNHLPPTPQAQTPHSLP